MRVASDDWTTHVTRTKRRSQWWSARDQEDIALWLDLAQHNIPRLQIGGCCVLSVSQELRHGIKYCVLERKVCSRNWKMSSAIFTKFSSVYSRIIKKNKMNFTWILDRLLLTNSFRRGAWAPIFSTLNSWVSGVEQRYFLATKQVKQAAVCKEIVLINTAK